MSEEVSMQAGRQREVAQSLELSQERTPSVKERVNDSASAAQASLRYVDSAMSRRSTDVLDDLNGLLAVDASADQIQATEDWRDASQAVLDRAKDVVGAYFSQIEAALSSADADQQQGLAALATRAAEEVGRLVQQMDQQCLDLSCEIGNALDNGQNDLIVSSLAQGLQATADLEDQFDSMLERLKTSLDQAMQSSANDGPEHREAAEQQPTTHATDQVSASVDQDGNRDNLSYLPFQVNQELIAVDANNEVNLNIERSSKVSDDLDDYVAQQIRSLETVDARPDRLREWERTFESAKRIFREDCNQAAATARLGLDGTRDSQELRGILDTSTAQILQAQREFLAATNDILRQAEEAKEACGAPRNALDVTYSDRIVELTDGERRVEAVAEALLRHDDIKTNTRNNPDQKADDARLRRDLGKPVGTDATHLIASMMGSEADARNLVAFNEVMNRHEMAKWERDTRALQHDNDIYIKATAIFKINASEERNQLPISIELQRVNLTTGDTDKITLANVSSDKIRTAARDDSTAEQIKQAGARDRERRGDNSERLNAR